MRAFQFDIEWRNVSKQQQQSDECVDFVAVFSGAPPVHE